jgi:membrane-associated protease RseP (regulator of RpoE activity)
MVTLIFWYQHHHSRQSSTDRERIMKTKCLQIICASTLILSASPAVFGQEALKELENLLRNKQPPVQPSNAPEAGNKGTASGDTQTSDLKLSPPDAPIPSEELPVPGSSPRKAPLVITPSKKPVPSNPFPNATPPSNAVSQPRTANPGSANSGTELATESDSYETIPGGYLGLTLEPVAGVGIGLSVVDVTPQSPAWKGGFRIGDRIVGVAGQAVTTIDQFATEIEKFAPGTPIKFLVQRRGRNTALTAVLQDRTLAGQIQGMASGTAIPLRPPVPSPYLSNGYPSTPNLSTPNPSSPNPSTPYQPIGPNAVGGAPFLGVSITDISDAFRNQFGIPVYRGAAVADVVVGSTAELAGIKPGDCIVDIDGNMILRAQDVPEIVRNYAPGQNITISYFRGQQRLTSQVPLITNNPVDPVRRIGNARPGNDIGGNSITPEMLTPEYVALLQDEVMRLQEELQQTQVRLQALESQLQPNESRR